MRGLYRYLSPFAPDQSGAVSALYELGGILVVCDAGGCTGNVCGFDEPRWFTEKSAVFSAGIRDMDAILGRDDRLMRKIGDAVRQVEANFVALIGTPVPAVIGTDLKALARLAEERFGLPALAVDTTGMELYDKGQEKAYLALFEAFAEDKPDAASPEAREAPAVGILGATPLDLPGEDAGRRLAEKITALGLGRAVCYGYGGGGLGDVRRAGLARCNLAVSPSGVRVAQYLRGRFGTPWAAGLPVTGRQFGRLRASLEERIARASAAPDETARRDAAEPGPGCSRKNGLLIIHQQFLADSLRRALRYGGFAEPVDVATWFGPEELANPCDRLLRAEEDLANLVAERNYGLVAGDPLLRRALPDFKGTYIGLPHYAVSSGIFGAPDAAEMLRRLQEACGAPRVKGWT